MSALPRWLDLQEVCSRLERHMPADAAASASGYQVAYLQTLAQLGELLAHASLPSPALKARLEQLVQRVGQL